jgi:uncharacterized membrane protein
MIEPQRMVFVSLIASFFLFGGLLIYIKVLKKKVNYLVLLIIISFLPLISILRNGTYESGDLTLHAKFAAQFFDNISQGNLIPQWIGNHCGSYGCPVYIFIYPFPYYIASFFHIVGITFIGSIKLLLITSFIASGVGMYLWIKDELGEFAGFVAGIFYLFAPYHLIDLHFRVAIGEMVSFAILPFTFLLTKRFVESKKTLYFFLEAIAFGLLIISHQVTSFVALPLLIGYSYIVWSRTKKRKLSHLIFTFFSHVFGILLSSFYWLPVLIEGKLTWYVADDKIDFHPLSSFLYSQNRFGLLFQGHFGELYMNIGYLQWIVLGIAIYLLIKKKVKSKDYFLLTIATALFIVLFLLMQEVTRPIWNLTPLLKSFQFTWRLMIEVSLITSLIAALVAKIIPKKLVYILCFLTIMYTILNWGNRKMVPFLTDTQIRSQPLFSERPGIVDLTTPNTVNRDQVWIGKFPSSPIEILSGKGEIKTLQHDMTKHEYISHATTPMIVKENTYYYPGWEVFINNKKTEIKYKNPAYTGVITFNVPTGLTKINVVFKDTWDRKLGKLISFITLIGMGSYLLFRDSINRILKFIKYTSIKKGKHR